MKRLDPKTHPFLATKFRSRHKMSERLATWPRERLDAEEAKQSAEYQKSFDSRMHELKGVN